MMNIYKRLRLFAWFYKAARPTYSNTRLEVMRFSWLVAMSKAAVWPLEPVKKEPAEFMGFDHLITSGFSEEE